MESIVMVDGLCKKYDKFSLKNVSFELKEGCITGFIGVNGAGKTTTLRSILRLISVNKGEIQFFGMDIHADEKKIKDRLGIVLDEGCFYEELTIEEMKTILAPAYSSWCELDYKKYIDRFLLNSKQKISTLSKGMKIKYALALALSHKAEMLILDEPTSGLDPAMREELLNILKEYMKDGGKGVFFSTHITSDLDKIADELIMIDDGRIIFKEEKDRLLESHRVVRGDVRELNNDNRRLFLRLTETPFGFSGLSNRLREVKKAFPGSVFEHATIEDIMLANVERKKI